MGVDPALVEKRARGEPHHIGEACASDKPPLDAGARRLIKDAIAESIALGNDHVGTEHLLLALVQQTGECPGRALCAGGVTYAAAREMVRAMHKEAGVPVRTARCLTCGYDMSGASSATCPECGKRGMADHSGALRNASFIGTAGLIVLGVCVGLGGAAVWLRPSLTGAIRTRTGVSPFGMVFPGVVLLVLASVFRVSNVIAGFRRRPWIEWYCVAVFPWFCLLVWGGLLAIA